MRTCLFPPLFSCVTLISMSAPDPKSCLTTSVCPLPLAHDKGVFWSLSVLLTSAPASNSVLTTLLCPLKAAQDSAVAPVKSLLFTSAPASINRRTTSKYPFPAAHDNGDLPMLSAKTRERKGGQHKTRYLAGLTRHLVQSAVSPSPNLR